MHGGGRRRQRRETQGRGCAERGAVGNSTMTRNITEGCGNGRCRPAGGRCRMRVNPRRTRRQSRCQTYFRFNQLQWNSRGCQLRPGKLRIPHGGVEIAWGYKSRIVLYVHYHVPFQTEPPPRAAEQNIFNFLRGWLRFFSAQISLVHRVLSVPQIQVG